jgi:hypothetical protein
VGPAGAAHSTWLRRPDGPRGPCEYGFNKRRDVPRERDGALFLRFPSGRRVRDAGHRSARHDRYNRHRPQRRTARAAGRIRFAAAGVSLAALGKFSGYARLPPRDVSPPLTSPCPAHYAGRLGRSPLVRHRRVLSTATSTVRQDSPDEFFIPMFRYRRSPPLTERACGRRPCRCGLPCVQLVASQLSGQATGPGRK